MLHLGHKHKLFCPKLQARKENLSLRRLNFSTQLLEPWSSQTIVLAVLSSCSRLCIYSISFLCHLQKFSGQVLSVTCVWCTISCPIGKSVKLCVSCKNRQHDGQKKELAAKKFFFCFFNKILALKG